MSHPVALIGVLMSGLLAEATTAAVRPVLPAVLQPVAPATPVPMGNAAASAPAPPSEAIPSAIAAALRRNSLMVVPQSPPIRVVSGGAMLTLPTRACNRPAERRVALTWEVTGRKRIRAAARQGITQRAAR